jgi:hypothetical protein
LRRLHTLVSESLFIDVASQFKVNKMMIEKPRRGPAEWPASDKM